MQNTPVCEFLCFVVIKAEQMYTYICKKNKQTKQNIQQLHFYEFEPNFCFPLSCEERTELLHHFNEQNCLLFTFTNLCNCQAYFYSSLSKEKKKTNHSFFSVSWNEHFIMFIILLTPDLNFTDCNFEIKKKKKSVLFGKGKSLGFVFLSIFYAY